MKKIFLFLLSMFFITNMYSQISISSEGSAKRESYVMKDTYFNIRFTDSVYVFNINDVESTEFIRIPLGATCNDAITSLQTLYDWFKEAKTKDYIEFEANGETITMYKYTSSVPYFSNGDVEYIKNYIKKSAMGSVFGQPNRKRNDDKMVGWMTTIGQMKKAIEKLQAKCE